MKYDHLVKHNGIFYPAGTDVPTVEEVSGNVDTGAAEKTEKAAGQEYKGNNTYNKSDILRMNVEELKKFAAELGLEVTEESTGKALKEQIIAKLGL